MSKFVLMYVPAIHRGYVDFMMAHYDASTFYVWGDDLIDLVPSLRKDIRVLKPVEAGIALGAIVGRSDSMKVAGRQAIKDVLVHADPLVMPDDAVSHQLLDDVLLPERISSYLFHPVFLMHDRENIARVLEPTPTRVIERSSSWQISHMVSLAELSTQRSSDWWRKVGAVMFKLNDTSVPPIISFNEHMPTEFTPTVDGDVRAAVRSGVNPELTTAIHAEASLIAQAAYSGIETKGMSIFTTTFPCPTCARLIARSGITSVFYLGGHSLLDGEKVLRDAGTEIIKVV